MFGLRDDLFKDQMDQSSNKEDSWKSCQSMRDPYLRINVLSLTFSYRKYPDKLTGFKEFDRKECLTASSPRWKLVMSLGQDELILT